MLSNALDTVYGIYPEHVKEHGDVYESHGGVYDYNDKFMGVKDGSEPTAHQTRKWETFVEGAVDRFEVWWGKIDQETPAYGEKDGPHRYLEKVADPLPPLDVFMVWHAYMLNPHSYYEDCIRYDKMATLWLCGVPWKTLNEVIDKSRWTYNLSETARKSFTSLTTLPVDLLASLEKETSTKHIKSVKCPTCHEVVEIPLTTGAEKSGYLDPNQGMWDCTKCGSQFDRMNLVMARFSADLSDYQMGTRPFP
jgi:hypothetical protein